MPTISMFYGIIITLFSTMMNAIICRTFMPNTKGKMHRSRFWMAQC